MRILGTRGIPYGNLKFPGKWRTTFLGNPNAQDFAAILAEQSSSLAMPIVRVKDKKLLYGQWLIAAARQKGKAHVLVKVAEATEEEAAYLLEHDMAFPESTGEHALALHKMLSKAEVVPNGEAIIAEAESVARSSVTKRDRASKRRKRGERLKAAGVDDGTGIRSPWAVLDDDYKRHTNQLVLLFSEAAALTKKAHEKLTAIAGMGLPVHEARYNKAREQTLLTAKLLRGLVPVCICPYCKGVEALQEKCGFCMMTGYITESQEEGVAKELWATEKPVVVQQGTVRPLSDFILEEKTDPGVPDPFGLEEA
jgi:hypothetical protein